jgi:hypothetical protein
MIYLLCIHLMCPESLLAFCVRSKAVVNTDDDTRSLLYDHSTEHVLGI